MQAEIVCSYAVASTQEEDRVTMDSNGTLVCTLPRLEGWHIALTVIGASALVVAIVITIVGIVLAYKRKWTGKTNWTFYRIYSSLNIVAWALGMGGLTTWIALGVYGSNPPNGDVCDSDWQNSRDRSAIAGFCFSVGAFITASAAVIWLFFYPKCIPSKPANTEIENT